MKLLINITQDVSVGKAHSSSPHVSVSGEQSKINISPCSTHCFPLNKNWILWIVKLTRGCYTTHPTNDFTFVLLNRFQGRIMGQNEVICRRQHRNDSDQFTLIFKHLLIICNKEAKLCMTQRIYEALNFTLLNLSSSRHFLSSQLDNNFLF